MQGRSFGVVPEVLVAAAGGGLALLSADCGGTALSGWAGGAAASSAAMAVLGDGGRGSVNGGHGRTGPASAAAAHPPLAAPGPAALPGNRC